MAVEPGIAVGRTGRSLGSLSRPPLNRSIVGQTTMTDTDLLKRLERCFEKGETESLVNFVPGSGLTVDPASAWVKVIHRASGFEAVGDKYPSQVRNKVAALLEILRMLHESGTAAS